MSLYNKIIDLQKLDQAWERVRKNKPAAGVDNVTYDEFDSNRKEELKLLQQELKNHAYETLPVKLVNLYKGEKVRTIALYSMRDKAVQQSIAAELNKIFDNQFSERTFAYRNNKSALNAISDIERVISEGKYRDFLKVDITHYFDTIRWDILENVLRDYIGEDDVIELIRLNSCSKSLDEATGELVDKRSGIYQGSSIAPVLSNVYLMEFDLWLSEETDVFFVRYSDDLLLLGSTHEEMIAYLTRIKTRLEAIGLSINTSKSVVGVIADGFDFLGYHFDTSGKSIPSKAEDNLYERLEMMWLTSGNISIEEKLKKVIEIIGGWEQYFRGERNVGSVFEYAALAYTKGNAGDQIKWLIAQRCVVVNIYRDIAGYLAAFWNDNGCSRLELFEYEQFYHVRQTIAPETLFREELNTYENELLKAYKIFYALEDEEQATEIMQLYTDLKEYSIAEYWHGVASELHDKNSKGYEIVLKSGIDDIVIHKNTSAKLYGAFAGREDIYAREVLDAHRGRKIETELKPLTEAVFRDHLSGKITADAYIQRPNATVRYMIIDVDLSKKILLQYERGSNVYNRYMQKVLDYTCMLKKSLMNMGITGYIEYSGNRGYHLWVFFSEWIPVRYINILSDIIDVSNERDEDIAIEYFPNKTRIKGGKYGQAIKLPYGIHVKTGERSYFLNDAGEAVKDPDLFVDSIALASVADIKRIIAANSKLNDNMIHKEVDNDISVMGDVGDNVKAVLINCPLMRYICLKSVKTSYLTHQERLMVLYVFGHLGDDGNEFIHKVMSFTLNYKYDVTDHFIRKRPDKPISCIKLRDQYKQLTAEFGCNCNFKRNKNCYPSPVLHAISSSPDAQGEVTLPLSRTITKDKEDKVKNEMNVYNKTQEIASKLQDLKKQMGGINKMISKLEHELESIFDDQGVDELEIEMGVLCRRKTDKGVEWFVEI